MERIWEESRDAQGCPDPFDAPERGLLEIHRETRGHHRHPYRPQLYHCRPSLLNSSRTSQSSQPRPHLHHPSQTLMTSFRVVRHSVLRTEDSSNPSPCTVWAKVSSEWGYK